MKTAVIAFPGSNCDRDLAVALKQVTGTKPTMVWHAETALPDGIGLIAVPGGFSYGDYLRSGAIAARAPIMRAVVEAAGRGTSVLGVCNGFQVLTEAGLLPGALIRNAGLNFVCRDVALTVDNAQNRFTARYHAGETIRVPVAHHDGNYVADDDTLDRLEGEGPRRLPLCRGRQRQRPRHRGAAQRRRQRAGHDAPPGTQAGGGAWRDRRASIVRGAGGGGCMTAVLHGPIKPWLRTLFDFAV